MKTLVILGAGKASRLYPISSVIPKLLVNVGHKTVLEEILEEYNKLGSIESALIIVNEEHVKTVNTFINTNKHLQNFPINLSVLGYNRYDGSARTINHFASKLEGKNVIFNWSDIVPKFDTFEFDKNVVYTYGNNCRYKYDTSMKKDPNGNVIGIYQFKKFKKLDLTDNISTEIDLADCIPPGWETKHVNCIDVGDFKKLSKLEYPKTRSFNTVEIKDDIVIKTTHGTMFGLGSLHSDEVNWYESAKSSHFKTLIPEIISNKVELIEGTGTFKGTLVMGKVEGVPLYQYMKQLDTTEAVKTIRDAIALITPVMTSEDIHEVSIHKKLEDYYQEVVTKTQNRINSVAQLHLSIFGHREHHKIYSELNDYILKSYAILADTPSLAKVKYAKIHGDLNFSNIFKTKDSFAVIDPRGYYGTSKGIGPVEYEHAKILYALSGYDSFNTDLDWAGFDSTGRINIEPLPGYESVYKMSPVRVRIHLGIIWASLSGYFANNPYKSIATLYKALEVFRDIPELSSDIRYSKDGYTPYLEHKTPVKVSVTTKCPSKWLLIDEETGQKYRINNGTMDWVNEKL